MHQNSHKTEEKLMKESPKTQAPDSTQGATENPRPAWSKPTIRTMTVSFTEDGTSPKTPENVDANQQYTPPTS